MLQMNLFMHTNSNWVHVIHSNLSLPPFLMGDFYNKEKNMSPKSSYNITIKINIKVCVQPLYCSICGQPILNNQKISLDHHIPKCRGGADNAENLLPAHQICNSIKNDLMPEDFEKVKIHLYQTALTNWHLRRKDKQIVKNALQYMR